MTIPFWEEQMHGQTDTKYNDNILQLEMSKS